MKKTMSSIAIVPYEERYQVDIDRMMEEIAQEFDEPISTSSSTNPTLVLDKYWIALNKDKVVGTLGLAIIGSEFGVLKKMMLDKSFRGKDIGLSKQLLQTAIDCCVDSGLQKIYLGTMKQFQAAQVFYKQNGFQPISKNQLPEGFLNNPLDDVFFQRICL